MKSPLKLQNQFFCSKITEYNPYNGPGPTIFSFPIISLILSLTTLLFFVTLLHLSVACLIHFAFSLPEIHFLRVFPWLSPSISVLTQSAALTDSPI